MSEFDSMCSAFHFMTLAATSEKIGRDKFVAGIVEFERAFASWRSGIPECSHVELAAKNVRAARAEAEKYAPCRLTGFAEDGECVYISAVRARGDGHPVATATKDRRAVRFVATPTGTARALGAAISELESTSRRGKL